MSAKLSVTVEERVTDPDRWHPRMRRRVKEWAETRWFRRRGPAIYPTRELRQVRPTPPAALLAMTGKAAA